MEFRSRYGTLHPELAKEMKRKRRRRWRRKRRRRSCTFVKSVRI